MEFKHPKYYKELRSIRNNWLRSLAKDASTEATSVHPGPGLKVTSYKLPGPRPISNANKGLIHRRQASSTKLQASSSKLLK